ncbi:MAG: DNA gyrase inhibitor YacG [Pseudomonadota bacterium]
MTSASSRPCPICAKPRVPDFAPFCSQRCKDRDLAQWFGDGYSVPGPPASPEDLAERFRRADDPFER